MKLLQKVFYIFSISLLSIFIIYFGIRAIYFKIRDDKKNNYSHILYKRIIQQEENYTLISELEKINDVFYYTKKSKYNYVIYKGLTWRIIKFNETKITLILENSITNLPLDKVDNWLNDYNKKDSGIFYKLINNEINVDNSKVENIDVHNFMHIDNLYCEKIVDKITLLDIDDYNNAGGDNSYLNTNVDFWIKNKNDYKYIDVTGDIENGDELEFHNVRPVITLNSTIKSSDGNGSIDDPYYIDTQKANTLRDVDNNSYIKYNDNLWKIISNDGKKIKIVSEECIKDNDNKCVNMQFSNDNNSINVYNYKSAINYLNNTYYKSLKNKKFIVEGNYYIGKYSNHDYTTIYNNRIKLKVGLLTIADPYAYELNNVFLLTTNDNSNLSIYISLDEHEFESIIYEKAYLRPTLYLKSNISIKNGKGTYSEPYELGGIVNEED